MFSLFDFGECNNSITSLGFMFLDKLLLPNESPQEYSLQQVPGSGNILCWVKLELACQVR